VGGLILRETGALSCLKSLYLSMFGPALPEGAAKILAPTGRDPAEHRNQNLLRVQHNLLTESGTHFEINRIGANFGIAELENALDNSLQTHTVDGY